MSINSKIRIYLDNEVESLGEYNVPINFELDTRKLSDGEHTLRIISIDPNGREGVRKIPFTVRNGPDIAIEGIGDHDIVDGIIPVMVNAYSKGDQKQFLIEGSESPHSIPASIWMLVIFFVGWAMYYALTT